MLTGTENTLKALIITTTQAALTAKHGSVQTPNEIDVMAEGVADAIIPHIVSNTQVLPGSFASSVPVTGIGALL